MGHNLPILHIEEPERFKFGIAVDLGEVGQVFRGAYGVSAEVDPAVVDEGVVEGTAQGAGAAATWYGGGGVYVPSHSSDI